MISSSPVISHMSTHRPSNRRQASSSSRLSSYDDSPYPSDMPPGPEERERGRRNSATPITALSKEEIREREALINKFEAEEELIMNRLSRRMDELKASTARLSNTLEAESESIVNRLHMQLRVVEAQLGAAKAGSTRQDGSDDAAAGAGGGSRKGKEREVAPPPANVTAVGMQTFMTGSDPIMMGSVVQQLHEDKSQMQRQIDTLSVDNDALRQELIGLRQRLGIPVDDLIGLGNRDPRSNNMRYNRPPRVEDTGSRQNPTSHAANPQTTQPISFMRRPGGNGNNKNRSVSPQPRASISTTTTSSSSSVTTDTMDNMGSFPPTDPSSHLTSMTSPSDSPYAFSPASLPPVPHNTFISGGASLAYSPGGHQVGLGTGGMPLPYPSVPPPSLANSLASVSVLASPQTSPVHSRRPSLGRIAERGSFAGGREGFMADKRGQVEEDVIEE